MQTVNMVRLIADEGMILSNGKIYAICVDCCPISEAENWKEISAPAGMKINADSTDFESDTNEENDTQPQEQEE